MMGQQVPKRRELFHIGEKYYATINVNEDLQTFPLRLRALKGRLGKLFCSAMRKEKIETPADSGQIEMVPSSVRPMPWGWHLRGWTTGVLICAFFGAMPLLYSDREQLGELLIQLGQRLEAKPAIHAAIWASAPTAVPAPKPNPQQHAALLIHAPISSSAQKPSSPPVKENAESRHAELAPTASAAETSPMSLTLPLSTSTVVPGRNLTSLEPVEFVKPQAVSYSARDTRNLVTPYANSSAGKYFDVGKFRDELRANRVMDELGQLGFHAIAVRSRVLWMNSYHILVGPYITQGEVEAARYNLESRGFNPGVLQTKSKHFSLPPMTLYGGDLTIRDCVITWEVNSPDVTVEFLQGRKVVATSKGRWERRDFTFKNDAVVSLENERGPETLVEIQRAGMDQGLVFDGSALQFYMGRQ
jgi:hypothetical protein